MMEAGFWIVLAMTVFNPLSICAHLSGNAWRIATYGLVGSWLAIAALISCFGSPTVLFEAGWRFMTSHFSLFQIAVFWSAGVHVFLTLLLNIFPIVIQNLPHMQRYKIQKDKPPPSSHDWMHVFVHIFLSQLCVQLPLVTGQYLFVRYFNIPYEWDSMPPLRSMAWRLALSLVVDDTWVYFGHRFLHHKKIYKHVHKVHHTYQSPFAPDAEYEHPVETVFLGIGFFTACMLFTNHIAFMWAWLYLRLLVTYDSHSGYDVPCNMLHFIPGYNGAREHDWHHQFFNGNYAPTFVWWDRYFGTSDQFMRHEKKRRAEYAAEAGASLERRGDEWMAQNGKANPRAPTAGFVDKDPEPIPFSQCLVTGSAGMVGIRLVKMLASRGAKRVVCMDIVEGADHEARFKELSENVRQKFGTELTYVKADISDMEAMTGAKSGSGSSPFENIEVVFHLAALVGPFYKTELYDAVNNIGAQNVLNAFAKHGSSKTGNLVFVDCSTPSTRYPPTGDIEGLMEHEMTYQDTIHEYATTKALGEKYILQGNGGATKAGGKVATCAVAPHQVYAPEDKLFLPSMLQTAASGKLRIFGKGENIASFTHAENIAHALVLAGCKLWREGSSSAAAGEFFVVTDGGAYNFWDCVDHAVVECGYPSLRQKLHLSPALLWCVAHAGALYTRLTDRFVKLTPFTLRMLVINRTFCSAKARHVLGYAPVISFEEGWASTVAAATKQHKEAAAAS
mmetsp:Transcript_42161/g.98880  ORF Transcript_42161/g.98880 Transcript_42161/m.98880 type:complete len:731 (-) Transcript_42161:77-2269(-)